MIARYVFGVAVHEQRDLLPHVCYLIVIGIEVKDFDSYDLVSSFVNAIE